MGGMLLVRNLSIAFDDASRPDPATPEFLAKDWPSFLVDTLPKLLHYFFGGIRAGLYITLPPNKKMFRVYAFAVAEGV